MSDKIHLVVINKVVPFEAIFPYAVHLFNRFLESSKTLDSIVVVAFSQVSIFFLSHFFLKHYIFKFFSSFGNSKQWQAGQLRRIRGLGEHKSSSLAKMTVQIVRCEPVNCREEHVGLVMRQLWSLLSKKHFKLFYNTPVNVNHLFIQALPSVRSHKHSRRRDFDSD